MRQNNTSVMTAKYSNRNAEALTATAIEPTIQSINAPQYQWLNVRYTRTAPFKFSEQPEVYAIRIQGKTHNGTLVVATDVIEAYHPYMALGEAVSAFQASYFRAEIHDISLTKRSIKTKRPQKQ